MPKRRNQEPDPPSNFSDDESEHEETNSDTSENETDTEETDQRRMKPDRKYRLLKQIMKRNRQYRKEMKNSRIPRRFSNSDKQRMAQYVQSLNRRPTRNEIINTNDPRILKIVRQNGKSRPGVFFYIRKHFQELMTMELPNEDSNGAEFPENQDETETLLNSVIELQNRNILKLSLTNERLRARFAAQVLWESEYEELRIQEEEDVETPLVGVNPLLTLILANNRQRSQIEQSNIRIMTILLVKDILRNQTPEIKLQDYYFQDFYYDDLEMSDTDSNTSTSSLDDPILNPQPCTSSGISRSKPLKRKRSNKTKENKRARFDFTVQDLFGSDTEESDEEKEYQNHHEESAASNFRNSCFGTALSASDFEPVEISQENSNQDHNAQSGQLPENLDANQNILVKTRTEVNGYHETTEEDDTSSVSSEEDLHLHLSSSSPSTSDSSEEETDSELSEGLDDRIDTKDETHENSPSETNEGMGSPLVPLDTSLEREDSNNNKGEQDTSDAKNKHMTEPN